MFVHSSQEEGTSRVSVDRRGYVKCDMYTEEHYSALERKSVLTHAAVRDGPCDITLSEMGRTQCRVHALTEAPRASRLVMRESGAAGARGWGSRRMGAEVPCGKMKMFW